MTTIPSHDFSNQVRVQKFTWGEEQNYDFQEPHRHKYIELIFFKEGGGKHIIGSKEYCIKDQSIHVVNSGMIHQVKRSKTSSGYNIAFRASLIIEDLMGLQLINIGIQHPCSKGIDKEAFSILISLIEQIRNAVENKERNGAMYLINALLAKLINIIRNQNIISTQPNSDVLRLLKVVQNNKFIKPKPKDISKDLNVSIEYLNRLCQKEYGLSSQALIDRYLIEFIKQDIMYTGRSIKRIAYDYSFHDPSHFNRFFKKNEGITPGEFRKSIK